MKKYLFLILLSSCAVQGMAQSPKWAATAKKALLSIITYDEKEQILNTGNGFFITPDGVALSAYSLFKGAKRATVVNGNGEKMEVESIMGANDMYDVIKFKVATAKKQPALETVQQPLAVGTEVFLLGYATQQEADMASGKITNVAKVEGKYSYYTLALPLKDKMENSPLMTVDGKVFGIAQKSVGVNAATTCYAVGVLFAQSQGISALSAGDAALRTIGIKKSLPDNEEQALVSLYVSSSQLSADDYAALLHDFVKKFPNNTDGYMRRASYYASLAGDDSANLEKAEADMAQALKITANKAEVYYAIAKLIYSYQLSAPEKVYKDWTWDRALAEVRSALRVQVLPVYSQLEGDILFAKQDYAGAFAVYEKINGTDLVSPATFYSAAKAKELMGGTPQEVIVFLDSCIARCPRPILPDVAPYLLERAQMQMNAEQYREALADYDTYFDAVKGSVNDLFYYYRGTAATQARQFQRALDDLTKAIELAPQEMLYRAELGALNIRVGRSDQAALLFEEALKIDPQYAEGYRLLGLAQFQLKKNAEACASWAKAKELGDPNVDELIQKHCN
jgi:tetratricopeptide (TPR) repeat protein